MKDRNGNQPFQLQGLCTEYKISCRCNRQYRITHQLPFPRKKVVAVSKFHVRFFTHLMSIKREGISVCKRENIRERGGEKKKTLSHLRND